VVGYSLGVLFSRLGASSSDLKEIRIGDYVVVHASDLDDRWPPVLYIENGQIRFLRQSEDEDDVNRDEWLRMPLGSLTVAQREESSLQLHADVSRSGKAKVGDGLTFNVTPHGGASKSYIFEWDFRDGSDKVRTDDPNGEVNHVFEKAGTYRVRVYAKAFDEEDGETVIGEDGVRVSIGKAKQKPDDQEGGGDNTSPGAPDSGTYDGDSGAGSSTGSTTPYSPSAPTPSPSTDGFDSLTPDSKPFTSGNTVEGALLANIDAPLNESTESALRAARTGDPDFEVPEASGVLPPAAWAGLGALALMGAGAGLESGRRPRLRRPARLRLSLPRR
jgi:hypothetical protein